MNQTLLAAENKYTRVRAGVAKYAAEAYKSGRLGVIGVMLNANSPDEFLTRSAALEKLTARDESRISELVAVRTEINNAKAAVDASVKEQAKHLAEMAKLRKAADKALSALGGEATRGWVDPDSPLAIPAKRNADGTWPKEICSINDPTRPSSSACITPRTLHAYEQAREDGFKRYTSCWRPGDMYEHPKGRACDFSAAAGGFGGTASGETAPTATSSPRTSSRTPARSGSCTSSGSARSGPPPAAAGTDIHRPARAAATPLRRPHRPRPPLRLLTEGRAPSHRSA
ncbi:coiled-coil domain-containing protein [Catellatospora coxensis]